MDSTWITLYDVSRDGIGFIPWFGAGMWLAGICGGAVAFTRSREGKMVRVFLFCWLAFWIIMGGFGFGNVLYRYAANYHALKTGSCRIVEGPMMNFRRQDPYQKTYEEFVVSGQKFAYSESNLGGGGLRNSDRFILPLADRRYVRTWSRGGTT